MHGRITEVAFQRRRGRRCNVFIDGRYAFSLSVDSASCLYVGQELAADEIEQLTRTDEEHRALEAATRLLSYRPRAEREIRTRLVGRFSASAAEEAIARLRAAGLINDGDFAAYWAEQRTEFRPRGARLIQTELKARGVASDLARSACEGLDEVDAAVREANRRVRALRGLDEVTARRRLVAHLGRRGFDWETVRQALRRLSTVPGSAPAPSP